jgi:hypothetical protein
LDKTVSLTIDGMATNVRNRSSVMRAAGPIGGTCDHLKQHQIRAGGGSGPEPIASAAVERLAL